MSLRVIGVDQNRVDEIQNLKIVSRPENFLLIMSEIHFKNIKLSDNVAMELYVIMCILRDKPEGIFKVVDLWFVSIEAKITILSGIENDSKYDGKSKRKLNKAISMIHIKCVNGDFPIWPLGQTIAQLCSISLNNIKDKRILRDMATPVIDKDMLYIERKIKYKKVDLTVSNRLAIKSSITAVRIKKMHYDCDNCVGNLFLALKYLHKNLKVVQNDISENNIMISLDKRIFMIDMGDCIFINNIISNRRTATTQSKNIVTQGQL